MTRGLEDDPIPQEHRASAWGDGNVLNTTVVMVAALCTQVQITESHALNRWIICYVSSIFFLFQRFFKLFFLVISAPNMVLELTTLRPGVAHSSD